MDAGSPRRLYRRFDPAAQRLVLDHGQHAQRHALAVVQAAQMLGALDAVADGVAKVQHRPEAGLPLVVFHHVLFHHQAAVQDLFQVLVRIAGLKQFKQVLVGDQAGFHRLGQTVDEMAAGQRGQRVRSATTSRG